MDTKFKRQCYFMSTRVYPAISIHVSIISNAEVILNSFRSMRMRYYDLTREMLDKGIPGIPIHKTPFYVKKPRRELFKESHA
jgi:hypothetical protein